MLSVASLLAQHARALVRTLYRALDAADERTIALVAAGVSTATRSIVAFGRAVAPIIGPVAIASTLAGVNLSNLAGDPNAETLRAALTYIVQNADAIAAFATHDPQLKTWLDWLISEIRRNTIETKAGLPGQARQ